MSCMTVHKTRFDLPATLALVAFAVFLFAPVAA